MGSFVSLLKGRTVTRGTVTRTACRVGVMAVGAVVAILEVGLFFARCRGLSYDIGSAIDIAINRI